MRAVGPPAAAEGKGHAGLERGAEGLRRAGGRAREPGWAGRWPAARGPGGSGWRGAGGAPGRQRWRGAPRVMLGRGGVGGGGRQRGHPARGLGPWVLTAGGSRQRGGGGYRGGGALRRREAWGKGRKAAESGQRSHGALWRSWLRRLMRRGEFVGALGGCPRAAVVQLGWWGLCGVRCGRPSRGTGVVLREQQ